MRHFKKILLTSLLTTAILTPTAQADTAVIVHPDNPSASLDASVISRMYLGKTKKFPGGSTVIPIDQSDSADIRSGFLSSVMGKSARQVKSYWSKRIFTGKGTPPKQVGSSAEVKELISSNPSTIGYIDASEVDGSVKVIYSY